MIGGSIGAVAFIIIVTLSYVFLKEKKSDGDITTKIDDVDTREAAVVAFPDKMKMDERTLQV